MMPSSYGLGENNISSIPPLAFNDSTHHMHGTSTQNLTSTWPADQIWRADAMHPPGSKPCATIKFNQVVSIEAN